VDKWHQGVLAINVHTLIYCFSALKITEQVPSNKC